MRKLLFFCFSFALFNPSSSSAHYHMLIPQSARTERDKPLSITLQWGHPFEHQIFDAARPESIIVMSADGTKTDLSKSLDAIMVPAGDKKEAKAFRFRYTPRERGDFTIAAVMPPIWIEEEQVFWQDTVKVVLHVQSQKGWDAVFGHDLELVPLTRPYGLQSGMVFQVQALAKGKPLAGAMVEVERYNPIAPAELPEDEQITRRVKSDPNGIATCNLTDAGWWCITVERDAGQRERQGKMQRLRQRATFWIYADQKGKN